MVVRMRHNRAQRGNTRSHHALKEQSFSTCPDCGAKKLNHKVCPACGKYKGKIVIDVLAKTIKKDKKNKAKNETAK